jgi:hypothetical protein
VGLIGPASPFCRVFAATVRRRSRGVILTSFCDAFSQINIFSNLYTLLIL